MRIKNAPPEITSLRMIQEPPNSSGALSVEVAVADIDGDIVTYTYGWTRNGKGAGTGKQIEGRLKRGDVVTVNVTPFDREVYGDPAILRTEIKNTPRYRRRQTSIFCRRVYTHWITASDLDGDPITYSLHVVPEGMVIDKATGLITWTTAEKDSGTHRIVLKVSDGHGGDMLYSFDVTLKKKRLQ